MIDKEIFTMKLTKKRLESGLTQRKLADLLCISPQVISKWETTISLPDIDLILPICKILGMSSDYLLTFNNISENMIVIKPFNIKDFHGYDVSLNNKGSVA